MKDLFSAQSALYARYRPHYPESLFHFLFDLVPGFDLAWDAGCGNGQVADRLSRKFTSVIATDLSAAQLDHAVKKPNIQYLLSTGRIPSIPDNSFSLVTIGTALHWFDLDVFYDEVKRTAGKDAIIAAWCYSVMRISEEVDPILDEFAFTTLNGYWDEERRWVDEHYRTIPFPFEEIPSPRFEIHVAWDLVAFEGYLNTWSSVQHYIKANGINPVNEVIKKVRPFWKGEMPGVFPLHVRVGKVK